MHSPFAYRFVTDVLRPGPYIFYSYHEIDKFLEGKEHHDPRFIREIRFIIRLANFLKSKRIVAFSPKYRGALIAARAMKKKFVRTPHGGNFVFSEGDLLIIDNACHDSGLFSLVEEAIGKDVPVYMINPSTEEREFLEQPRPTGLLLDDRNKIIMIPRSQMAYLAYHMNLEIRS